MKIQALLSSKDKRKKLKCRLLQFLFGALRVKVSGLTFRSNCHFYLPLEKSQLIQQIFSFKNRLLFGRVVTNFVQGSEQS